MTPIEFLHRLNDLSDKTPLHIAHMGAMFEMVSPILVRHTKSDNSISLSSRLTNEAALASWLGEPIAIVQAWRMELHSAEVRYRLGPVYTWIIDHIIPLVSAPLAEGETLILDSADIDVRWKSTIPAMLVDGNLIGFFRSIEQEVVPDSYTILEDLNTLALQPARMSGADLASIDESLQDHEYFSEVIGRKPAEAMAIYKKWKNKAMPEVLLQFLRTALAHDEDIVNDICKDLDVELVRQSFNVTAWLWNQLLDGEFCEIGERLLINTFDVAISHGVNINENVHIADASQRIVFHGNVSHLLADTRGNFFKLPAFEDCSVTHASIVTYLLDHGLNPDKQNNQALTARAVGDHIDQTYGAGQSPFKSTLDKYEMYRRFKIEIN